MKTYEELLDENVRLRKALAASRQRHQTTLKDAVQLGDEFLRTIDTLTDTENNLKEKD
jgi:hypothetical protein